MELKQLKQVILLSNVLQSSLLLRLDMQVLQQNSKHEEQSKILIFVKSLKHEQHS